MKPADLCPWHLCSAAIGQWLSLSVARTGHYKGSYLALILVLLAGAQSYGGYGRTESGTYGSYGSSQGSSQFG